MNPMLTRLHRDERGMSLVFVGLGFMAFLAAATLAIDVGMFMTARTQAQTAADAGAMAGAVALATDDYDNRSSSGPAVQSAMAAARQNQVMASQVDMSTADVTFPLSPAGLNNRVRVQVHRTAASGVCQGCSGAVRTLFGGIFGVRVWTSTRRRPPRLNDGLGPVCQAIRHSRPVDRADGKCQLVRLCGQPQQPDR